MCPRNHRRWRSFSAGPCRGSCPAPAAIFFLSSRRFSARAPPPCSPAPPIKAGLSCFPYPLPAGSLPGSQIFRGLTDYFLVTGLDSSALKYPRARSLQPKACRLRCGFGQRKGHGLCSCARARVNSNKSVEYSRSLCETTAADFRIVVGPACRILSRTGRQMSDSPAARNSRLRGDLCILLPSAEHQFSSVPFFKRMNNGRPVCLSELAVRNLPKDTGVLFHMFDGKPQPMGPRP